MSEFKRIVQFSPGFDKRHPDPNKNYGIKAMQVRFVLVGEKGATQLVFSSGWYPTKLHSELVENTQAANILCKPLGYDWGYHSPKPLHEGQMQVTEECEYLDRKGCYYDGSSLSADEYMWGFIENGEEWLWAELEKFYQERFGE